MPIEYILCMRSIRLDVVNSSLPCLIFPFLPHCRASETFEKAVTSNPAACPTLKKQSSLSSRLARRPSISTNINTANAAASNMSPPPLLHMGSKSDVGEREMRVSPEALVLAADIGLGQPAATDLSTQTVTQPAAATAAAATAAELAKGQVERPAGLKGPPGPGKSWATLKDCKAAVSGTETLKAANAGENPLSNPQGPDPNPNPNSNPQGPETDQDGGGADRQGHAVEGWARALPSGGNAGTGPRGPGNPNPNPNRTGPRGPVPPEKGATPRQRHAPASARTYTGPVTYSNAVKEISAGNAGPEQALDNEATAKAMLAAAKQTR